MISITDYDYDLDCGWSDKQNRKVGYICSVNKLVVFLASSSGGRNTMLLRQELATLKISIWKPGFLIRFKQAQLLDFVTCQPMRDYFMLNFYMEYPMRVKLTNSNDPPDLFH